jgi:predicted PurR-regulated permease PerM
LLILLLVAFMLADAASLPSRLRAAFGGENADLSRFYQVADSVNTYLWVKTWISLLTGVLIGGITALLGLDFAILWGFLAFIFNYIPNIGSLIAAIPAVLLGLLQGGWDLALWTAVVFLVVNNVIGNVVEPRVLGRKMGLSSLVVFLSLLIWSALLGPIGMLLSVPLTMVIKIALESTPDGKGIAALLGDEAS